MDRKFLFDINVFDAPPKDADDAPPPPPVFSEEELAAAKDMAFEQGRQQGQREQKESREQFIAQTLDKIARDFSRLFAAETVRENVYEKESLKLALSTLDLLFPSLNEKIGRNEVYKIIEKTLIDHRKTKEITIKVSDEMKSEIETLVSRIRSEEHEEALWRVLEDPGLQPGDCVLEWSDGGAVRDSGRSAREIRRAIEALLGDPELSPAAQLGHSEAAQSDVSSTEENESPEIRGDGEKNE